MRNTHQSFPNQAFLLFVCISLCLSLTSYAAGKKSTPIPENKTPFRPKKVVELRSIDNASIELPDQSQYPFGKNLESKLVHSLLSSEEFIVTQDELLHSAENLREEKDTSKYIWAGSLTASSKVEVKIQSLTYQLGSRGDRFFYGFNERQKTPIRNGTALFQNEFPLNSESGPAHRGESHFFDTFQNKGDSPFDARSGLNLGDGFSIDALFAWFRVKYAKYHSQITLRVLHERPFQDPLEQWIEAESDGFFFDASGGYSQFSGGIRLARSDAIRRASLKAIDSTIEALTPQLRTLPYLAQIDEILPNQTILLGTGPFADLPPGWSFESIENPEIRLEILANHPSGASARLRSGAIENLHKGLLFHHGLARKASLKPQNLSNSQSRFDHQKTSNNFSKAPNLHQLIPQISRIEAFGRSLIEGIFLPYRIYRYFHYDQDYREKVLSSRSSYLPSRPDPWMRVLGIKNVPQKNNPKIHPIIAIIDSGVDYNHPLIHDQVWINPTPKADSQGRQDRIGWDFISDDPKPFDDHYHGTQVASLISQLNPDAEIMILKAFNPWGITQSQTLYAALKYAIDHGAQIIVCAWETQVASKALEIASRKLFQSQALLVTSIGTTQMNSYTFPAQFAEDNDHIVTVAPSTLKRKPYFSSQTSLSTLSAPVQDLRVAEPRGHLRRVSSPTLATALVAGVLSEIVEKHPQQHPLDWKETLLNQATSESSLLVQTENGRFLQADY